MLDETGCATQTAQNGIEVVELFRKDPLRYGCILMDMQMPEMDGLEATRAIRALPHPWAKKVPIVAMTANVFQDDVEHCLAAGMDDHIGKPIEDSTLYEKLAFYLHSNALHTGKESQQQAETQRQRTADFLPYVNVDAGLAKLHNNRRLFATLLGSYQKGNKYQGLADALAAGDTAQAAQCTATLKGSVDNIALEALLNQLTEIEPSLKLGIMPGADKLRVLQDVYKKTEELLPQVIRCLNMGTAEG
jgi:CheY-like chemotaxis protein